MNYLFIELITYLFIYSFLGWILEVCLIAVKERRFCNRGFFNLPFCFAYGFVMDFLLLLLPTMKGNYVQQFVTIMIVLSAVEFLSGALTKRISRKTLWNYEEVNLFSGSREGFLRALVLTSVVFAVIAVLHPVIYMMVSILPHGLVKVVCIVLCVLVFLDFILILFVIRNVRKAEKVSSDMKEIAKRIKGEKQAFSRWIYYRIWKRINQAYPNIQKMEAGSEAYVFAEGICFDKLVWIFVICSFLGDVIETFFCRYTAGIWMSRSSFIYGMFSVVWGFGTVVLTVILQNLTKKDDRYVFLAGCFIGGVYEYTCSVLSEVFLGTKFWDYSDMPFNIGGRTNLLFCFFWGLLSVIWLKLIYPRLSQGIEKVPPITGKILTWVMIVFMVCDAALSAMVIVRYTKRSEGKKPKHTIEYFLDDNYGDTMVRHRWRNLRLK